MASTLTISNVCEQFNILETPTRQVSDYLVQHPILYKAALVANHLFRAISMAAFTICLPFSIPVNLAICFAGSLFYRLTVETNCAFKFAMPSFAGSLAIPIGKAALASMISGVACASMGAFASSSLSLLPLVAYLTYVVVTVNEDVDLRLQRK